MDGLDGYLPWVDVILEELHVGIQGMFLDAGFIEVSRPTLRRVEMRVDF